MAKILLVGGRDTEADAAGWYVTETGLQPIEGWSSETAAEVRRAVYIIHEGSQMRTPGLAQAATRAALDYVNDTVAEDTGDSTVIVLGGPTMGMDSPGTVITIHSDGTVTVGETPGWEETWSDALHAANILRESLRLSEPALAEATMNSVANYLLERTATAWEDRTATMILM